VKAGQALVRDRFSWDRIAGQVGACYEEILAEG
jgi:hypothetical protein